MTPVEFLGTDLGTLLYWAYWSLVTRYYHVKLLGKQRKLKWFE